jgi:LEA14-like dessication related protein
MIFALLRNMKWRILIPSLLLLAGSMISCKEVKDPEFRKIDEFGLRNLSLQEARVGFNVTYFNPNDFGVTVKEAEANIYLDSTFMGTFTQDTAIQVNKQSDFTIPFSGTIPLRKAMELNLESLSQKDILLKADGNVKVGKAGIYVSRPIHYQGLHRLDEIQLNKKVP